MTKTVTAKELKNHTGEVLRAVGAGERVIVTRRGRPFALVSPLAAPAEVVPYEEAWAEIDAALQATEPEFADWQTAMDRTRRRAR